MNDIEMIETAIGLASAQHRLQRDKRGQPYILHPIRVMLAVERHGYAVQAVAVMHDLVEDTEVTLETLRDMGFPAYVVMAVDALTKRKGESHYTYITRVSENRIAVAVKLADLHDNLRPERLLASSEHDFTRIARYRQEYDHLLALQTKCLLCDGTKEVSKPPIFVEEQAAYEAAKDKLIAEHGEGSYVLIRDSEIVGVFSGMRGEDGALAAGYAKFGVDGYSDAEPNRSPFMVRELLREQPVIRGRYGPPPMDPCPACGITSE